jgi:hypothetical protein
VFAAVITGVVSVEGEAEYATPFTLPTVVATVPADEVTSPVSAGICPAATDPEVDDVRLRRIDFTGDAGQVGDAPPEQTTKPPVPELASLLTSTPPRLPS